MKSNKLSIVILNYNTREVVKRCLASLKKSDGFSNFEVVVVDNGSTDGSLKMVRKNFTWVKLVKNNKNLGFAAGNNVILKKVISDHVLLLNPDTLVKENSINRVWEYLKKNKNVAAATCRVELPNGQLDYSCHRGFPTVWNTFCYFSGLAKLFPKSKLFSGYTMTYCDMDKVHEIDSLTGAFALIKTKAGKEVGWFDEDYFWNGEDLDICYKLKEKGWKIVYIPDVKIIHFKGSASGLKNTSNTKIDKSIKRSAALSSTQVMRIFYGKHLENKYPFFINWVVYLGIKLLKIFRKVKTSV